MGLAIVTASAYPLLVCTDRAAATDFNVYDHNTHGNRAQLTAANYQYLIDQAAQTMFPRAFTLQEMCNRTYHQIYETMQSGYGYNGTAFITYDDAQQFCEDGYYGVAVIAYGAEVSRGDPHYYSPPMPGSTANIGQGFICDKALDYFSEYTVCSTKLGIAPTSVTSASAQAPYRTDESNDMKAWADSRPAADDVIVGGDWNMLPNNVNPTSNTNNGGGDNTPWYPDYDEADEPHRYDWQAQGRCTIQGATCRHIDYIWGRSDHLGTSAEMTIGSNHGSDHYAIKGYYGRK